MAKKNFKASATVLDAIISKDTTEEIQAETDLEAQEAMQTQGKAGMKMQRINMAFTPSNMDFIRVMASVQGKTMTQVVNDIIKEARENKPDMYEAAKELISKYRG